MKTVLLLPYFGNIEFFHRFLNEENIVFEIHETFPKQTYRNRTRILGANGVMDLSIPVKKPFGSKSKTNQILIDYSVNWQQIHWKSIESAYKNSPFFEYYSDTIKELLMQKDDLLIVKNEKLHHHICELLGIESNYELSSNYIVDEIQKDYRTSISPKIESVFQHESYIQVFQDRTEFKPNLSILDLLFNEGPNSVSFLL